MSRIKSDENLEIYTEDECKSVLFEDDQSLSEPHFKRRKLVVLEYAINSVLCFNVLKHIRSLCFNFLKHIRSSINVVRSEFSSSVDLLVIRYYCFKVQAIAGIIKTRNCLVGNIGNTTLKTQLVLI